MLYISPYIIYYYYIIIYYTTPRDMESIDPKMSSLQPFSEKLVPQIKTSSINLNCFAHYFLGVDF